MRVALALFLVAWTVNVDGQPAANSNYTVILRHGSQRDCPCFRIPSMVAVNESTLLLLVEVSKVTELTLS